MTIEPGVENVGNVVSPESSTPLPGANQGELGQESAPSDRLLFRPIEGAQEIEYDEQAALRVMANFRKNALDGLQRLMQGPTLEWTPDEANAFVDGLVQSEAVFPGAGQELKTGWGDKLRDEFGVAPEEGVVADRVKPAVDSATPPASPTTNTPI